MQIINSTSKVLSYHWSKERFFFLLCILSLHLQLIPVNAVAQHSKLLDFGSKAGSYPNGSLISEGTFLYGMTAEGGSNDYGTIFKIKPDGSGYVKLFDFDGVSNGSYPYGSLLSDGTFLYGMTEDGGSNNLGTIFKIKPDGSSYTKLLDFDGQFKGSYPDGDLISDGTFLYGMTSGGGEFNLGTIFKIKPDGTGFSLLLEFKGSTNGGNPYGSLTLDGTFLYGVTSSGGTDGFGNLFKIKSDGTGFTALHDFGGSSSGSYPYGSLLSDGTFLYGTTFSGGAHDDGVIFKIKFDGSGFIKLHDLQGSADGSNPTGSLISDGTFLYGMASYYGNDYGTIFKIKPDGTSFINLRSLNGATDGDAPYGSLISDGNFLYGMTSGGGSSNLGTVFKIKSDGTSYNKLLDFSTSGSSPYGSLISDGTYLYGMTAEGGASNYGTIFKVLPNGSSYITLFDFDYSNSGSNPHSTLLFEGNFLYGMTTRGGPNNAGTVFKIKVDGTGYVKLLDFDYSNGGEPYGSLISDGTYLYGMTSDGGSDSGVIFKIKTDGTGYVMLSDFGTAGAGSQPFGDLLLEGSVLYGMTLQGGTSSNGTIFKLNKDGTGYTTIFNFDGSGDGASPYGSLISDGTFLYGMTQLGGMGGGTIFKIKPDGTGYIKLQNLVGVDIFDGSNPYGSLLFDGTLLYGLTSGGGTNNLGTLFQIMPDGSDYIKLFDFDGTVNGSNPQGSLLLIGTSAFGMSQSGGSDTGGTLFKYGLNNPCPGVASITATSSELNASSGDSYQWYYFGEVISGATNQSLTYNTLEYGEYTVDVVKNGCTYNASFNYIITGQQKEINAPVQVFPNPVKENLFVNLPEADSDYALKLIDPIGRVSLEQSAIKGLNELKTAGLSSGLYYLVVKSHDDVIVFKVQKQ